MKTRVNMRMVALVALMAMMIGTADAHRKPTRHRVVRPAAVVVKPVVVVNADKHFGNRDRLGIALTYLDTHKTLTVKRYAKLTGLTKKAAKAELEAFARDGRTPLMSVKEGNKLYFIKAKI